jgi:phage-related protein
MGNINQFFKTYLADWDDLVGAKVIRRKTLEKYLIGGSAAANPPVEFNRDVFYIERKSTETPILVEFELVSAFDVEGVQLPRRSIIAARCPWKYKDTTQGGCRWNQDSRLVEGVGDPLYYDKDDNIIAKDAASPGTYEYTFWGRQDEQTNREATLYKHNVSYAVGAYVEYQRPIGSLYSITSMIENATDRVTITVPEATVDEFDSGDWLVIKGATAESWNHKNVPLYIHSKTVDGATSTLVVQTDSSATGTLSTAGYIQGCRNTLYKCIRAHTIMSGNAIDELVKPTNISYWEFGDICGKRLSSCSKRFAYVANGGKVDIVHVKMVNGVLQGGAGYTGQPTITFTNHADETSPAGSGAAATATISGGVITKFTVTNGGSNYSHNPTIAISGGGASSNAQAEARVKHQSTDNVALPFGGFPGASFG